MNSFNLKSYMTAIVDNHLSTLPHFDFSLTEVSGLGGLEGILSGQVHQNNFIATDSTGDGYISQHSNGGYFLRRVATIFIVRKYQYGNMADMLVNVEICRAIFKRILRQMIADKDKLANNLVYINTERIAFREFEPETSAHFTGLYFMLEYEQPYNILSDE